MLAQFDRISKGCILNRMNKKEQDKKCILSVFEKKVRGFKTTTGVVDHLYTFDISPIYDFLYSEFLPHNLNGKNLPPSLLSGDTNILELLYEIETESKGRFKVSNPTIMMNYSIPNKYLQKGQVGITGSYQIIFNPEIQFVDKNKYEFICDFSNSILFLKSNPKLSIELKGNIIKNILAPLIKNKHKYIETIDLDSMSAGKTGSMSKIITRFRKSFSKEFDYIGHVIQNNPDFSYRIAEDIKIEIKKT